MAKLVIENEVREALRNVYDPELGLDVIELGMIGPIEFEADSVLVNLRLTSMSCPFWELFFDQVESAVGRVEGIAEVKVKLDTTEPWTPELMTENARTQLEAVGLMPPSFRPGQAATAGRGELLQITDAVLGSPLRRS